MYLTLAAGLTVPHRYESSQVPWSQLTYSVHLTSRARCYLLDLPLFYIYVVSASAAMGFKRFITV